MIEQYAMDFETPKETLRRYQRSFLVHSFLYYRLDESIIADHDYDKRCHIMNEIMGAYPKLAEASEYYELCVPCGKAGSGFYIQNYPLNIITTALHLLHKAKNPPEPFSTFISRWGYKLEE